MFPMSLFGEGKSESVFFQKPCKKHLKKTEHADVGILTAHGPPGKKGEGLHHLMAHFGPDWVSKIQKQLKNV